MRKISAAIHKEILILIRDRVGLAILFLMPMILIFVMTLIQDSAFKSLNEKGIPILFVNDDKDSLGNAVALGLKHSELCSFHDSLDGKPVTAAIAKQAIANGSFLLGVVIPKGATEAIRNNVSNLVKQTLNGDELSDELKNSYQNDSVYITIIIDPITKKSFLSSVTSNLREFFSAIQTKIMFAAFSEQIAELIPYRKSAPTNVYSQTQIIKYNEVYASNQHFSIVPNAVQHNVPAWTIFAMFFIVMPLTGSIMKEKTEGSVFRLHTIPSSYIVLLNGKIAVYVIVCCIQFLLMLSVGLYFLPLLGLPKLVIGTSLVGIFILTIATALAATGYGVMVGTLAKSEQQGAIMGSLTVLLLSAIGGVWVPTYVMPELMRNISVLSPLNWSLIGFYDLFLRGGNVYSILAPSVKLIMFFIFTVSVAMVANKLQRRV